VNYGPEYGRRRGGGILTPFLLGVPVAAALIFAEKTFTLLRENFALGTICWVILAIVSMWVTLSVAAIVDRKPGDWTLWVIVILATILAVTWLSGYNIITLFAIILTMFLHK
jgi:hypothetical protein